MMNHMRSRLILFGAFTLGLHAQREEDPKELILAVQKKIVATTERLPRYMCTQTIDRRQYEMDRPVRLHACEAIADTKQSKEGSSHLATSDRLRLDVTVAAKSEIFSWVGENHFTDRSLWDFITDGIISTGNFSNALTMIFQSDPAEFSYTGHVLAAGRTLAEYGYQVPLEQSHYTFGDRKKWWTTAYEGTLQVDPKTRELVRLVLQTVNLPSETGECQTFDLAGRTMAFQADWFPGVNSRPSSSSLRSSAIPLGSLQSMAEHGIATYRYPSARDSFVLKRGLRSEWIAIAPQP